MNYDFFLCYSSDDWQIAEEISAYFEQQGRRCFMPHRNLSDEVEKDKYIQDVIASCKLMIVLFSDSFNNSEQTEKESFFGNKASKPIIIFRLSDVEYKGSKRYFLQNHVSIDAFVDPKNGYERLYDIVCKRLEKLQQSAAGGHEIHLRQPNAEDLRHQTKKSLKLRLFIGIILILGVILCVRFLCNVAK